MKMKMIVKIIPCSKMTHNKFHQMDCIVARAQYVIIFLFASESSLFLIISIRRWALIRSEPKAGVINRVRVVGRNGLSTAGLIQWP